MKPLRPQISVGIWKISQIPSHLENFPDTQSFGKFPRYPVIWEISFFDIFDNCCQAGACCTGFDNATLRVV